MEVVPELEQEQEVEPEEMEPEIAYEPEPELAPEPDPADIFTFKEYSEITKKIQTYKT